MALREWQQDENGSWSLDCSSELHDLRMKMDPLYKNRHIDKIEEYKEVPWLLRRKNKPLIFAAVLSIAWATGVAALSTIDNQQKDQTQVTK